MSRKTSIKEIIIWTITGFGVVAVLELLSPSETDGSNYELDDDLWLFNNDEDDDKARLEMEKEYESRMTWGEPSWAECDPSFDDELDDPTEAWWNY